MIKNLNDFLTFIVLIIITIFSFRILLYSLIKVDSNNSKNENLWKLILEYSDNEEE